MLQYRPLEADMAIRGYYNPHRDLAYCGLGLIQAGLLLLDRKLADPPREVKLYMIANSVTENDIDDVARRMGDMFNLITANHTLEESWEKSGLDRTPIAARSLVFLYLGESLLCAIFQSMRDQLTPDTEPPMEVKEFNKLIIDFTLSQRHKTIWDRIRAWVKKLWSRMKQIMQSEQEPMDDKEGQ